MLSDHIWAGDWRSSSHAVGLGGRLALYLVNSGKYGGDMFGLPFGRLGLLLDCNARSFKGERSLAQLCVRMVQPVGQHCM